MTDSPPTIADTGVVTLRCTHEGCKRWQTAQARHLENLLAAGRPYLCPDHDGRRRTR